MLRASADRMLLEAGTCRAVRTTRRRHVMDTIRKGALAAMVAGSMLAGVVVGATAFGANALSVFADTGTTGTPALHQGPTGSFVPNEDPAHEAGESAGREAQDDAGQFPTVP